MNLVTMIILVLTKAEFLIYWDMLHWFLILMLGNLHQARTLFLGLSGILLWEFG